VADRKLLTFNKVVAVEKGPPVVVKQFDLHFHRLGVRMATAQRQTRRNGVWIRETARVVLQPLVQRARRAARESGESTDRPSPVFPFQVYELPFPWLVSNTLVQLAPERAQVRGAGWWVRDGTAGF